VRRTVMKFDFASKARSSRHAIAQIWRRLEAIVGELESRSLACESRNSSPQVVLDGLNLSFKRIGDVMEQKKVRNGDRPVTKRTE
jgi:hypothetical protein